MKVEIFDDENNKVILDIIFRKTNTGERRRFGKKELIDTACMIFRDGREIACAIARQNPLDDYNKIVGKKIALTKAIVQIKLLKLSSYSYQTLTGKHRRKVNCSRIWKVFHKTFGRWN
jgi:hypothetical protein